MCRIQGSCSNKKVKLNSVWNILADHLWQIETFLFWDTLQRKYERRDYEVEKGNGHIFNGQAPSEKTTLLCQMVKDAKNLWVLPFINKASEKPLGM